MVDYSTLSDEHINKAVGDVVGVVFDTLEDSECYHPLRYWKNGELCVFEPCNNSSDAWSIINENKISIMFDSTDPKYEGEYYEWCDAISPCHNFGIQHQSNPLRAAMIVFLMMQGQNSCN